MPFRVFTPVVACGFLLALSGCYSYPQYGPNGYYGQPPGRMMPSQPGPTLGTPTPAGPEGGSMDGTTPQGSWMSPSTPGTGAGTGTWDPNDPASGSSGTGTAPGGGSSRENIDTQRVPDATNLDFPPDLNQSRPQNSPADKNFDDNFGTGGGASLPRGSRDELSKSGESELDFQPPIEVTAASSTRVVAEPQALAAASGPNPFNHDRKAYRFLQGVVEYVAEDKSWRMMYSAAPEAGDKFGGDIALKDHPGLQGLQNEDVVYVEGRIDSQSLDRSGKPRYEIDHMQKLVPKHKG